MAFGQSGEKYSGFYLAHDIGKLPIGTRLLRQTPHVTETPPCDMPSSQVQELHECLATIAGQTEAIALSAVGLTLVGHRELPTLATKFEKTNALADFHHKLMRGLGELGCEFVGLNWALENYNPHCEGMLVEPGEQLLLDNITVFTKRRNPSINGLEEITARYDLLK